MIRKIDSNIFSLTILKVTTFSRIRHQTKNSIMAHNYMKYGALSALLIASINMQAAQEGTTRYTILTQSPEQHYPALRDNAGGLRSRGHLSQNEDHGRAYL